MAWPPRDMNDVVEYVTWQGDLAEVQLGLIRDACGWERLKVHVVEDVRAELDKHDLVPLTKLRRSQNQKVWIYRRGTPMAKVLEGSRLLSEAGIESLRLAAGHVTRVNRLFEIFGSADAE